MVSITDVVYFTISVNCLCIIFNISAIIFYRTLIRVAVRPELDDTLRLVKTILNLLSFTVC